ncbi:MAG TPA: hypothetical protein VHZ51_01900, partial [Ktedonobacteraceae bacterium]|nr:hypothetical protein [Ktedonobacteraceae bacterium]
MDLASHLLYYSRTLRELPKAHWIDAACVGRSTPLVLSCQQVKPLFIKATGHGIRQRCLPDRYGFPRTSAKGARQVKGFQTGDIVKAIVPTGKKVGTYVGRVAVRSSGSFNPPSQESPALTPGEEWRVLIWGLGWVEPFTDMAFDILCEMLYTCSMKQLITAKLKLHTDPAQFQALRTTQLAYRDALNAVSRYSFAHGKKSNQQWLQQEMYAEVRAVYHLPAQMACNVP